MKPYICRVCGHQWYTNYVRCIGKDGSHRPSTPIRNRRWQFWK